MGWWRTPPPQELLGLQEKARSDQGRGGLIRKASRESCDQSIMKKTKRSEPQQPVHNSRLSANITGNTQGMGMETGRQVHSQGRGQATSDSLPLPSNQTEASVAFLEDWGPSGTGAACR